MAGALAAAPAPDDKAEPGVFAAPILVEVDGNAGLASGAGGAGSSCGAAIAGLAKTLEPASSDPFNIVPAAGASETFSPDAAVESTAAAFGCVGVALVKKLVILPIPAGGTGVFFFDDMLHNFAGTQAPPKCQEVLKGATALSCATNGILREKIEPTDLRDRHGSGGFDVRSRCEQGSSSALSHVYAPGPGGSARRPMWPVKRSDEMEMALRPL